MFTVSYTHLDVYKRQHATISDREYRADRTIILRHGEPMIFGKNNDKGLIFRNRKLEVVTIGQDGITCLLYTSRCV